MKFLLDTSIFLWSLDAFHDLNKQAQDIFALPEVQEKLEQQGVVLPKASPEQFAKFLGDEDRRWRDVIARAKITFAQ